MGWIEALEKDLMQKTVHKRIGQMKAEIRRMASKNMVKTAKTEQTQSSGFGAGIAAGLTVAAVAAYFYRKNNKQEDEFEFYEDSRHVVKDS